MKAAPLDDYKKARIAAAYAAGRLVVTPQFGKSRLANFYCVTPEGKVEAVALDIKLKSPWLGSNASMDAAYTLAGMLDIENWHTVEGVTVLGL